jgi:competence protein ComEC
MWSVVCLMLVGFGIRYYTFTQFQGDPQLQQFSQQNIEAEGVVISEPDERETSVRFVMALDCIIENKTCLEITRTNIILSDFAYSKLRYGDRVHVQGVLKEPENFVTENGREFNYKKYLQKDRVFYQMSYADIKVIRSHQGNFLKDRLFSIKHAFIEKLDTTLPYPESRLAAGLIVAGKRSLPKAVQDEFQQSGTLQVVVLSGYNVSIIAEMLMNVTSSLPQVFSVGFGIVGIIFFVIMAGGSATIVRGGVMAILVIIAKRLRRRYSVSRALITTGVIMLFWNPMLLLYDPSFQLSFLATAGLIYVSPLVEKYLTRVTTRFNLRSIMASTIAAQLAVMPLQTNAKHRSVL